MKAFYFAGQGNYSDYHGWDNGLEIVEISNLNIDDIYYDNGDNQYSYNDWFNLHDQSEGRIYSTFTEHGGSRECEGVVFASSVSEAQEILVQWTKGRFPVKEMVE